jgi:hypothetical protein
VYNFFTLLFFLAVLLDKGYSSSYLISKKEYLISPQKELTPSLEPLAQALETIFDQAEERLIALEYSFVEKEQKEFTISVYQKILSYKKMLPCTTSLVQQKEIIDHIGILTTAHCLLPDTLIELDSKTNIKSKLYNKTTYSALYFANCLFFDKDTQKFSLSQFAPKEESDLSLCIQIAHLMYHGNLPLSSRRHAKHCMSW